MYPPRFEYKTYQDETILYTQFYIREKNLSNIT